IQRLLKPRTPHDCPLCRQQLTVPAAITPTPPTVTPWCEQKSRRGAPKRINTQGFACPNRRCTYYHIIDAHLHALVGDGAHGRAERIQNVQCQACGATFSARRGYPLGDTALSAQNGIPTSWRSADSLGRRARC